MTNPPQVPQPGISLPQGPPPPNRALWWVLGTIIALLLLIIGGGFYVASRMVKGITVKGPNQVELKTPAGEINIQKPARDNTGLPVYPGAVRQSDNGAQVQIEPLHHEGGFGLSAATYEVSAKLQSVADWYRQQLDSSFVEGKRGGVIEASHTIHVGVIDVGRTIHVRKSDVAFVSQQNGRTRIVALKREGSQVKITLLRMGEREPQ